MLCFNVDLDIKFYFEFENTEDTHLCKSCEKNFALNESLKCHIIEVNDGQCKQFKEAL
jgi:hypothetical protein